VLPKFEPGPWNDKQVTWEGKLFLKDRVRSFLHIPLNFGAVMKRGMATIRAAGAVPDEMVVLSDENSLWGAMSTSQSLRISQGRKPAGCQERS